MTIEYSNKFRKILFDKISNLSTTEHEEIFKMVKSNDISFTQNKNGIFFNISTIDDCVIEEIDNFVTYCMSNKTILDEYDKKLNECKINNNFDNIIPAAYVDAPCLYLDHAVKINDDEWVCLSSIDSKKIQKITNFVEKMAVDREKIGKKKMNVKFHNARKKYAKRVYNTDKRFGSNDDSVEIESELTKESYNKI